MIAIDPSSAFSGGAVLGDRVRMPTTPPTRACSSAPWRPGDTSADCLAPPTTRSICSTPAGYDPILVETVGVGQDEVDVVKTADVVAVVLVPGMGDDIQALKAGVLEIADLFVINKADRPGADRLHTELDYMLALADAPGRHKPEVLRTVATEDRGIDELQHGIGEFLDSVGAERPRGRRRDRAESRFLAVLGDRAIARVLSEALDADSLERMIDEIAERKLDPYSAAEQVLRRLEVR